MYNSAVSKRRFLTLLLCFGLVISLAGLLGCQPEAGLPSDAVIDVTSIIETLAAPEMRGRLVGSAENEAATEYIRDLFAAIGLTPFDDAGFLNPFEQEVFDIEVSNPQLTVYLSDGSTRDLVLGSEFIFGADQGSADARLTFIANTDGLDAAAAAGKILSVSGATGFWWEYDIEWLLIPSLSNFIGAPFSALLGETARHYFDGGLFSGGMDDGLSMITINEDVYNELRAIGIEEVYIRSNDSRRVATVHNVVGLLEGRDSSRAVVVSAHFDGVGFIGDLQSDGAIDNASGTAALIYLASLLAERQDELAIDVIFAAFNGEETGLIGSFEFVPQVVARYDTLYNINIDCVGVIDWDGFSLCAEDQLNSALHSALRAKMAEHDINFSRAPYGLSDHFPFTMLAIPAISIGQADMSRIHTPDDRIEFLDMAEIERLTHMLADFIISSGTEMFIPDGSFAFGDNLFLSRDDLQVQSVLAEIGGLAYDEAYHFTLDDGGYVLVTGRRPLTSLAEVHEIYPAINFPERVGDFAFQEFIAWGIHTEILTGDNPFQRLITTDDTFEYLPLNEVLQRELVVLGFDITYANSVGEQVRLQVMAESHSLWCAEADRCTFLELYPNMHFLALDGGGVYLSAVYVSETANLNLWLDIIGQLDDFLELDQLVEVVNTFDLPSMVSQYQWQLANFEDHHERWLPGNAW